MIKVQSLSYIYNQKNPYQTKALENVSFTINQGEIIGIIGPSGSGKSCLLRCIAGVIDPTTGSVSFDSPKTAGPEIGLVIQEPEVQFFNETVYQEVAFALENQGLKWESTKEIVTRSLYKTGYYKETNLSPYRLSGGEQRRVAIASILALSPQILLMDEPTVGLDYNGLEMISQIIEGFRLDKKIVIIVSHDLDFLYRQVDRYLLLSQGCLTADFNKTDYEYNIDLLNQIGLAIPEIVGLKNKGVPIDLMKEIKDLKL